MKKHKITVVLTQTAPGDPYVATFPAFPGWATQGDTVEDALRLAKELVELNLAEDEEGYSDNLEVARASFAAIGEVEVEKFELSRHTRKA